MHANQSHVRLFQVKLSDLDSSGGGSSSARLLIEEWLSPGKLSVDSAIDLRAGARILNPVNYP